MFNDSRTLPPSSDNRSKGRPSFAFHSFWKSTVSRLTPMTSAPRSRNSSMRSRNACASLVHDGEAEPAKKKITTGLAPKPKGPPRKLAIATGVPSWFGSVKSGNTEPMETEAPLSPADFPSSGFPNSGNQSGFSMPRSLRNLGPKATRPRKRVEVGSAPTNAIRASLVSASAPGTSNSARPSRGRRAAPLMAGRQAHPPRGTAGECPLSSADAA
mmetsp:Transcript_103862/g.293752  ORF Transcript_103862/g.293752 Transcript_103862/m.293752 type:complete len:214 (+) Transcript_103862:318-959(+)